MVFYPHGYTKENLRRTDHAEVAKNVLKLWNATVQQQLKTETWDWEQEHKMSVAKVLFLTGKDFDWEEGSLINFIKPRLQSALHGIGGLVGKDSREP
jgi:hypothetical protein